MSEHNHNHQKGTHKPLDIDDVTEEQQANHYAIAALIHSYEVIEELMLTTKEGMSSGSMTPSCALLELAESLSKFSDQIHENAHIILVPAKDQRAEYKQKREQVGEIARQLGDLFGTKPN